MIERIVLVDLLLLVDRDLEGIGWSFGQTFLKVPTCLRYEDEASLKR